MSTKIGTHSHPKGEQCFDRTCSRPVDIEEQRGKAIAEFLHLRKRAGRYNTSWGTKTATGLYRCMQRLVNGEA